MAHQEMWYDPVNTNINIDLHNIYCWLCYLFFFIFFWTNPLRFGSDPEGVSGQILAASLKKVCFETRSTILEAHLWIFSAMLSNNTKFFFLEWWMEWTVVLMNVSGSGRLQVHDLLSKLLMLNLHLWHISGLAWQNWEQFLCFFFFISDF